MAKLGIDDIIRGVAYAYDKNVSHEPTNAERRHNRLQGYCMARDKRDFGSDASGVYGGVGWTMKRPKGTYWCGYISFPRDLPDDCLMALDREVHGGFTGDPKDETMGFDCNHGFIGDWPADRWTGTYRDYHYVLGQIKNLIEISEQWTNPKLAAILGGEEEKEEKSEA
jgi:hypothetical protein